MLYRFREAQAAELGLGTRGDRRPRMASACKSLRECERWRGDILREISRKVSKIQDAGLTDYEVRDLNDEINKLLREKRHWENQIVALGGANYRRNVAMLDDDGKEVPGTKGYKYFGRAKDLPGVRELFQSKKKEEEEENIALAYYRKFMNQGPSYYGDMDEADAQLLEFERAAEQEDWKEAWNDIHEALGMPETTPIPDAPQLQTSAVSTAQANTGNTSKRKKGEDDAGDAPAKDKAPASKKEVPVTADAPGQSAPTAEVDVARKHAEVIASYISFLSPEQLLPPKLPSHDEMESFLLNLRKQALVEEYFGQSQTVT
ncbi:Isy1-like splicing factor [Fistulina hepatica ATCC 64428]|uniref:Isy1-like splicing factor n=1 Tax=Fistulina hepatica ATCC 64428 TaxID=1128425 RepID=A0A0D7A1Y3_9AGAR|nr:Isy1-like splicing factor [Fistulina hepatica ATCC 64428]